LLGLPAIQKEAELLLHMYGLHLISFLDSSWQKNVFLLEYCQKLSIAASGRNDREHQKTAMHTVATIAYDAVNPFELAVATEIFGFERPELGVSWFYLLCCSQGHHHTIKYRERRRRSHALK
jgi:hypothetical protein